MSIDWKVYQSGRPLRRAVAERRALAPPGPGTWCASWRKWTKTSWPPARPPPSLSIKEMGVTFTVYTEEEGTIDRAWPFDIIPRIIAKQEWDGIEAGLKQRVQALNLFIDDLYHEQKIVKDGVFPAEVLAESENFRPQCVGVDPPLGIWAHICGSDLVRDGDGTMYVLEDNLRVPSGVSYMLENRLVTKRVFPELFERLRPAAGGRLPVPAVRYPGRPVAAPADYPEVVVLTPGIYNSAYFEHCLSGPADGLRTGGRAATCAWTTTTASTCAPSTAPSGWT